MGKSMMAIDGMDLSHLMAGLEGIHELRVELTVSVAMPAGNGALDITVSAWKPTVAAHQTEEVAKVAGTWPDQEGRTLTAYAFALCYELDRAIGKAYAQQELSK